MSYYIGIDGGGSKTRAVLMTEALRVVGRGTAGSANHHAVGGDTAAAHCRQAAKAAVADAQRTGTTVSSADIAGWGFGLAGVRRESDAFVMRGRLNKLCAGTSWRLETDAMAAHFGAFGGKPGIIQIAGTGAICLGVDDNSEHFYTDGWGPLLGDDGSGYWMGQQALRLACSCADGRSKPAMLADAVPGALGLSHCHEIVSALRVHKITNTDIASLSKLVLTSAEGGCKEAIAIREKALALLANSVAATAQRMLTRLKQRSMDAPHPISPMIALLGGLFEDSFFKSSLVFQIDERFVAMKRDFLPIDTWRILPPQHDAATGAALLILAQIAQRKKGAGK